MLASQCTIKTQFSDCIPIETISSDGVNWSKPRVLDTGIKGGLFGPPTGPQLSNGRLIYSWHVDIISGLCLWSDDNGNSFKRSSAFEGGAGESEIAQLPNSTLIITIRAPARSQAYSFDYGNTWTKNVVVPDLPQSDCQGSIIWSKLASSSGALLFSTIRLSPNGNRQDENIWISNDFGKSWNHWLQVYPGAAGYSCLYEIGPNVVIYYEKGTTSPYEKLSLAFIQV